MKKQSNLLSFLWNKSSAPLTKTFSRKDIMAILNNRGRITSTPVVLFLALFVFLYWTPVRADDTRMDKSGSGRLELGEIVVTASGAEEQLRRIPRNVTVITSEDIDQAPSNNLVDLLAREANVNPRSIMGTDKQAGIDLRGMGDTFGSNVVVMVDGFRLNPSDMAGPDFSAIPLDQIERIEIVRGAGSVLYGDGAVGGVINIITKKGQAEPEFKVHGSMGSYQTSDGRVSFRGKRNRLAWNINADCFDTDGYRDNGYLKKKDAGLNLDYDLTEKITFSLSAATHRDWYGLPGALPKIDASSSSRRTSTLNPEDFGETLDDRYAARMELDLGRWGQISLGQGFRFRDNHYIMGYTPLLPRQQQMSHIDEDSDSINLNYRKDYQAFGKTHRFQFGFDGYSADYVREMLAWNQRQTNRVDRQGFFILNQWALLDNLTFHLGGRRDDFKGTFNTDLSQFSGGQWSWVNTQTLEREWRNDSYDLGLVYSPISALDLFLSYATSFRCPNVDEFAWADNDLHPQEGFHLEAGGRYIFSNAAEFSLTLFQTRIKNEIYYGEDPNLGFGLNRNYEDETIRQGIEAELKVKLTPDLFVWGNLTLMQARFESKDTSVPLVPESKAALGFDWRIKEPLLLSFTATFVGARYDGSDENNNLYDQLPAYQVVDGKLTYQTPGPKVFFGVNNMFNEQYATVAYSEWAYPMPGLNAYGGLEWTF